jgi:photosystem II stability/assembly factor-like uncharacterized protein
MEGDMNKITTLIITLPLIVFGAEWQSLNGPPVGRADDMSIGEYESEWVIYAADKTHKLYKSTNEGENWDSIYTHDDVVYPTCVITDPNNAQVVYIGRDYSTPVYKSENGGVNWDPKSDEITNTNPLCFAMDPDHPDTIYLGCKQNDSQSEIFKTINGGDQWSSLSNFPDYTVNEIAIRPNYPETLVAATEDGVYFTGNGGTNWYKRLNKSNIKSISYGSEDVVYAGRISTNEGLFKSTNGGASWNYNPIGNFSVVKAVAAVNDSEIYIAASGNDGQGIYRTTNGGTNWTYYGREDSLFCNGNILKILIDPEYGTNHQIYVAGDWAIYKFNASTEQWKEINYGFKLNNFKSKHISNLSKDKIFK